MRVSGMVGLVAMVLATSAQAAAKMPNTNLHCVGSTKPQDAFDHPKPFEETYRIDYTAKKWCSGDCKYVVPIVDFSDENILLMNSTIAGLSLFMVVSRVKGTLDIMTGKKWPDGTSTQSSVSATCTPQPFTGVQPPPPGPKPVPKF